MNDAFFVRRGQSVRDLQGVVQSLAQRDWSAAQALAQGLALEQFGDYVGRAFARADVEYGQNIGMVQRSGGESFLLKTAQAVGIKRKRLRQNFDRHFAFEARVAGAINLAHASRAEQGDNFIRPEFGAWGQVHRSSGGKSIIPGGEADRWTVSSGG